MTSIGDKYNSIARRFASGREKSLVEKKYLDLLINKLLRDAQVLDVGSGMGEPITSYLLQNNLSVTAMDASNELLSMAKNKFPALTCILGDMRIVTLTQKYDGIVAWDTFFFVPKQDQKEMFKRTASWLKPNGKLLFTTGSEKNEILEKDMYGEKFSYFSYLPEDYTKWLNEAGFTVLLSEEDKTDHRVWLAELQSKS